MTYALPTPTSCNTLHTDLLEEWHGEYYIGMMSGTSLDALDAVLCKLTDSTPQIIATHSTPFDDTLHHMLLALCQPNGTKHLQCGEFEQFGELDFFGLASRLYGQFAADVVQALLDKSSLNANDITAIGCHGQTVRHRPEWGFSLQLLDPNILAERTGIAVVSDFRRRDLAVGGQGAPLVPAFHQAVFDDQQAIVLNLGGIANITVLGDDVIGYDTGVANLLMDSWIGRHKGQNFDQNGDWARSGAVDFVLLDRLMSHEFLAKPAPKSTGRETFHLAWLDETIGTQDLAPKDVQATLCEFTALSISREIQKFAKTHSRLIVCGGGAYNGYLLERLSRLLPQFCIQTSDALGISPTWVEALAFAWLARQTISMQTSNIPAVTGAKKGVVLGVVCF